VLDRFGAEYKVLVREASQEAKGGSADSGFVEDGGVEEHSCRQTEEYGLSLTWGYDASRSGEYVPYCVESLGQAELRDGDGGPEEGGEAGHESRQQRSPLRAFQVLRADAHAQHAIQSGADNQEETEAVAIEECALRRGDSSADFGDECHQRLHQLQGYRKEYHSTGT